MNIEELKPGKELDKLVAEYVFGGAWLCGFCCPTCKSRHFGAVQRSSGNDTWLCHGCYGEWLPEEALSNYSTDIADAWKVVDKLQELPPVFRDDSYEWFFIDAPDRTGDNSYKWVVGWKSCIAYEMDCLHYVGEGITVMEAICKAALYRVLQDLEDDILDAGLTEMSHV